MRWLYVLGFVLAINLEFGTTEWDGGTVRHAVMTGTVQILHNNSTLKLQNNGKAPISEQTNKRKQENYEPSPSSFEWFLQPKPNLTTPPNCPFLPFFVGFKGNSLQSNPKIGGDSTIVDISKQIAIEILKPNSITGMKTLSKFTTLARILRTMSFQQLKKASEKLLPLFSEEQTNENRIKTLSWAVFRDGISQAGTGPAFLMITEWLTKGTVEGEEAAEIISVLPNVVRLPTTEYMAAFFDLVTNEKVASQKFLNVSAILSFTNLVRKVLVSNESSHNRFPVHSFGRFSADKDKDALDKYLLYLANQLKDAVTQGDSPKIQVYIRALGNVGHKDIFNIFEPYLEGKSSISEFQRLTIIASLDKISKIYPKTTRSILYNIYQNIGETQEMRVAAVIQLMKTKPSASILQRMADFTNYDHNKQVVSVVKSAIEEAARLKTPRTQKLAQNARSAVNLLTTNEFGLQYSRTFIRSYLFENDDLGYNADFSYIQGRDSIIPSSIFYNHKRNMGGLKRQNFQMAFMSSSSDDLLNFIYDHFSEYPQKIHTSKNKPTDSKWSWDNIENMFKFNIDRAKPVEGNFLFTTLGGRRFFPFDNNTIEQILNEIKHSTYNFRSGKMFNFTKLFNQHEIQLGFPTATGLPFFFSLSVPTLVHLNGKIIGKAHPDFSLGDKNEILVPISINASLEIDYVYSSNIHGKMGFTSPFNHQTYAAGVEKNLYFHVPIHSDVDIDLKYKRTFSKIKPLDLTDNNKLFECSSTAYTKVQDILDLRPWSYGSNSHIVHMMKTNNLKLTFGEKLTGFAFDVKLRGGHPAFDLGKIFSIAKHHNGFSNIIYPYYKDSISNYNFTLSFNSKMTTAKFAKLLLSYGNKIESSRETQPHMNEEDIYLKKENMPFTLPTDRAQRYKELYIKASNGIKDSYTTIIDAELAFSESLNYVASTAYASSPVSENSRFMLRFNKYSFKDINESNPFHLSLQINSKMRKVDLFNYERAVSSDPTSYINAWLNYGQDKNSTTSVSVEGILKRSNDRLQFLKSHSVSKACENDMKRGNYIQPVCRNVTGNANILDQYDFTIKYYNVPDCCKNMAYKAYSLARYLAYPRVSENNRPNDKETMNLRMRLTPSLNQANISIETPVFSTDIQNIAVDQMFIPLVVSHPEYSRIDRFSQKLLQPQQFPVCTIDQELVSTFDNRQFPFKMGKCWLVLTHAAPKPRDKLEGVSIRYLHPDTEQISIVAHTTATGQKELVAMLGKNVIKVQPSKSEEVCGSVRVNTKQVELSTNSVRLLTDEHNNVILKIGLLPAGSIKIEAPLTGVTIIYDGFRIELHASNRFRNQMRGICGNFDGEDSNDFMTANNCIMKYPLHFITSYTLSKDCDDSPTKEIFYQIEKMPCLKEKLILNNAVYSENRDGPPLSNDIKSNRDKELKNLRTCISHIVKIIEKSGETCFSLRPQIKCRSRCKATKEIEKTIDFHCVSNNLVAKQWIEMVKKGGNPDLIQKGSNHREAIKLPESCKRE